MKQRSICLISPGHVASNPRLVKEANALHNAGFQVCVLAGDHMAAVRPLDKTILSQAPWSWVQVGLGSKPGYLCRILRQRGTKLLASTGWVPNLSVATWVHSQISDRLAQVATAQPADLYIAHCLAALPAAAKAAQRHGAKLGFDAEDFHIGELTPTPENAVEIAVRDRIERTLLPRCQHLTAASPGIADAYAKRYRVLMEPILNVFPLAEAPKLPGWKERDSPMKALSLYWFSQTIGPGRGLESVVRAMGQMQSPVRLHLRGMPAAGYLEQLQQLAQEVGVGDRIHLLPSAPPAEMARLAAHHDVGLSLEPGRDANNKICLSNKIFTYLLAGLPILMSNTPAQQKLAGQLEEAALLIDINDPEKIAMTLDALLSDPIRLEHAQMTAWRLGRERYNWNIEQSRFLNVVEKALR